MTEPRDVVRQVQQWIEKAEHDLCNAEHTLTIRDDECPFDTVCFHAQQCVEKYLKSWLISQRRDVPRSHDLVVLLNLALVAGFRGAGPQDVQPLNRYTIEARYPGDWDPIDRLEAEQAVAMAQRFREAVRALLPSEVFQRKG
jgi:HEPN domain-containing protein